jgi:hypothetical protein
MFITKLIESTHLVEIFIHKAAELLLFEYTVDVWAAITWFFPGNIREPPSLLNEPIRHLHVSAKAI